MGTAQAARGDGRLVERQVRDAPIANAREMRHFALERREIGNGEVAEPEVGQRHHRRNCRSSRRRASWHGWPSDTLAGRAPGTDHLSQRWPSLPNPGEVPDCVLLDTCILRGGARIAGGGTRTSRFRQQCVDLRTQESPAGLHDEVEPTLDSMVQRHPVACPSPSVTGHTGSRSTSISM